MSIVKKVMWFGNLVYRNVGIVLSTTDMKEPRIYINNVDGLDEEFDTKHVLEWGAKISLSQAEEMVKHLKSK